MSIHPAPAFETLLHGSLTMGGKRLRRFTRLAGLATAAAAGLVSVVLFGCVSVSNGTWYFKSASTPEGWPELTPVGKVEVKNYPVYRAATVANVSIQPGKGDPMGPMFMTLFDHIKKNDIAMTAPVDMGFAGDPDAPSMTTMAFLYRSAEIGAVGEDGDVRVEDLQPRTFASVGVRGSYTIENFKEGLHQLNAWLAENREWQPDGPARYLGYNSPFVPWFWRYGEVQVPVQRASLPDDAPPVAPDHPG